MNILIYFKLLNSVFSILNCDFFESEIAGIEFSEKIF